MLNGIRLQRYDSGNLHLKNLKTSVTSYVKRPQCDYYGFFTAGFTEARSSKNYIYTAQVVVLNLW